MQIRDVEIDSSVHASHAGNVCHDDDLDQPSRTALLAALDAAQLAGNHFQAVALIEQIYSAMDIDYAVAEQDD